MAGTLREANPFTPFKEVTPYVTDEEFTAQRNCIPYWTVAVMG